MNLVEVNGGNKTQREICHKVGAHMIKKLLPRFRTLDIQVNLVNIKSDAIGFCMMQDTNRKFEIELDKKLGIKESLLDAVCTPVVTPLLTLKILFSSKVFKTNNFSVPIPILLPTEIKLGMLLT